MIVSRTSPLTRQVNSMDLPVTQEQLDRYRRREDLIQNIFPELSAEQREFIQSGYTPEDWAKIFPPEEEE